MPLPSARRIQRLSHRAIVTLVAASLLSMPVTYRGGAEAAHAHTIFQLWEDVRTGSYTHHGSAVRAEHHGTHAAGEAAQAEHDERGAMGGAMPRSEASADPGGPLDPADVAAREPARGSPIGTGVAVTWVDGSTPISSTGVAGVQGVEGTVSVGADEDAPTVGSAFTPEVRGSVLVLTTVSTAMAGGSSQPVAERTARPVSLVLSPLIPPPRTAA